LQYKVNGAKADFQILVGDFLKNLPTLGKNWIVEIRMHVFYCFVSRETNNYSLTSNKKQNKPFIPRIVFLNNDWHPKKIVFRHSVAYFLRAFIICSKPYPEGDYQGRA
jgi:hypothetical protein